MSFYVYVIKLCSVLFAGKNLDKNILKQLFITTVTERENQQRAHVQEDQVCSTENLSYQNV